MGWISLIGVAIAIGVVGYFGGRWIMSGLPNKGCENTDMFTIMPGMANRPSSIAAVAASEMCKEENICSKGDQCCKKHN